jgi:hypothetical protein
MKKVKSSSDQIKEILNLPRLHLWDELQEGDLVELLLSAYGEADDHFTPGRKYRIVAKQFNRQDPDSSEIAIRGKKGDVYSLPYTHFNIEHFKSKN